jgi:ribonuclease T1
MNMKRLGTLVVGLLFVGGFAATGNLDMLTNALNGNSNEQSVVQPSKVSTASETSKAKKAVNRVAEASQSQRDTYGFRDEGICGSSPRVKGIFDENIFKIAKQNRLRYPYTFVNVTNTINKTGRLPKCYLTKNEAENRGWHRGDDLWDTSPGHSIGGNRFGNYEKRLPTNYGQYIEADIDFDGDRRGAKRLVFIQQSRDKWVQWLTIDHYDSFKRVDPTR